MYVYMYAVRVHVRVYVCVCARAHDEHVDDVYVYRDVVMFINGYKI